MLFFILCMLAQNTDQNACVAQPEIVYDKKEIIWLDATDDMFVFCLGDGTVICRDVQTGRLRSQFMLKNYIYGRYAFVQLFLSKSKHPKFATVDERPLFDDCDQNYKDESDGTDKPVKVVTFFDVFLKTSVGSLRELKGHTSGIKGRGFSEDGKYFTYLLESEPLYLIAVDPEKNKVAWRLPIDKYGLVQMWPGQGLFISIERSTIKGYDRSEKLIWTKELGPDVQRPEYIYGRSQGPYAIIEDDQTLFCLSPEDGRMIWTRPMGKGTFLVAMTSNARCQAFMLDNELVITFLPDSKIFKIQGVIGKVEGVFAKNGKEFLCLPELAETKEDKKANTVTMVRKSKILRIFDTKTGKLLRQFDLEKMRD